MNIHLNNIWWILLFICIDSGTVYLDKFDFEVISNRSLKNKVGTNKINPHRFSTVWSMYLEEVVGNTRKNLSWSSEFIDYILHHPNSIRLPYLHNLFPPKRSLIPDIYLVNTQSGKMLLQLLLLWWEIYIFLYCSQRLLQCSYFDLRFG